MILWCVVIGQPGLKYPKYLGNLSKEAMPASQVF